MRKFAIVIVVVLLLVMLTPCVYAAGSAYMSGPETVRAGDTITVSFVAGGGILGGNGVVSYDSALLTLQGYSQSIGGSWAVEFSGNNFVFYDNNMDSPISGSATIFQATFLVNGDLAAGTNISVTATGVTLSDGNADTVVGSCTYSATIAPPLSDNCQLSSLTVSNATISPAFSADVTQYTASVPFSTSSLQVSATAADSKATVAVGNTTLTAGGTTSVVITVTAENGATKEYVIQVARASDPNYVKSSNANLKALTVEGFPISPVFSAEVTRYYVWLPYEQTAISASAEAEDKRASVKIGTVDDLAPGLATELPVTVTAEDGTEQVYTLCVFRAPVHEDTDAFLQGQRPEQPVEPTEPVIPTEPVTEPTEPATEPVTEPAPTTPPIDTPEQLELKAHVVIVVGCICLVCGIGIGVLVTYLIVKKRR